MKTGRRVKFLIRFQHRAAYIVARQQRLLYQENTLLENTSRRACVLHVPFSQSAANYVIQIKDKRYINYYWKKSHMYEGAPRRLILMPIYRCKQSRGRSETTRMKWSMHIAFPQTVSFWNFYLIFTFDWQEHKYIITIHFVRFRAIWYF